jgi:hypothetical protein
MIEVYQWNKLIAIIDYRDWNRISPKRSYPIHRMWAEGTEEFTYIWTGQYK